jgi:hypothetical protein
MQRIDRTSYLWYVCKKVEIGLCEVISGIYIKKFEFFNEK